MAVKKNNDMKAWTEWEDEDIKLRKPEAIEKYTKELKQEIDFGSLYSIYSINSGLSSGHM